MANNLSKKTYRYLVNNFEIFTKFQVWRTRNQYTYKIINDDFVSGNPTIHFIHRYITNNTGDKACGYYQYFLDEFKDYRCIVHDINCVTLSLIKREDIVIIGGGGLLNATAEWNYNINKAAGIADKAIIWSAGFNAKKGSNSSNSLNWDSFDLVTVRDFSYENFRYTPCATCVMPALEKTYVNKRKIGVVGHKDVMNHLPEEMKSYELITNSAPIEEFVEFIGTSEIVFTNSYHAAYWSILMQKKCILFAPRSEKYDYYKYPPTLFSGDIAADISRAVIYPNALQESRSLTLGYLKDIKSLIKQKNKLTAQVR
jgi:hypothetical protein